MKAIWEKNTPYSQFLISVGVILLLSVTFTVVSMVVATASFGLSMAEMQKVMSDLDAPNALNIMRVIQTLSSIGAFILPPFLIAYLFSQHPLHYLGLSKLPRKNSMLLVVAAMILITPVINFLGEINSHLHLPSFMKSVEDWMRDSEDKAAVITKKFLEMNSAMDLFINLIMIGLIPAIGEELVFRGVVQKIFSQWSKNVHIGIWSAAFLFSAMHMQFYGFLPRMMLGGLLGYLYVWSGSLWLPIIGHFVNNAGAVLMSYFFQRGDLKLDPDKIGAENDLLTVAMSLVIGGGLFYFIYLQREKEQLLKE